MRIMSYYNCGVQDRGPYNSLAYAVPEQQNKRPGCLWADENMSPIIYPNYSITHLNLN